MRKIGRNDPCPCGSGKKFKKCHMGREDDLSIWGVKEVSEEMSAMITCLPEVRYGRSREMADALDIPKLTGCNVGIKFVDLKKYVDLGLPGSGGQGGSEAKSGSVFINLLKTVKTDPANVYIAISPDVDDSTLIHQMAHVLDYLAGSHMMPGTLGALSMELDVPVDHLEHPEEFGYWLDYLKKRFEVGQDADDAIISFLYENGMLIKGNEIQDKNNLIVRSKSNRIFTFLGEKSQEIDALIRNLPGYLGARDAKD
ncbi:MAG: SEC-C domain-containing protein [Pseudomonadota bacterium]